MTLNKMGFLNNVFWKFLRLTVYKYNNYLYTVSCWSPNGNDYSYIREKIWEFVNIKNNYHTYDYKFKLMKYIDNEINMMNSSCLLNNM